MPKFYRVKAIVSVVVEATDEKEALKDAYQEFDKIESDPFLPFEVDSVVEDSVEETTI